MEFSRRRERDYRIPTYLRKKKKKILENVKNQKPKSKIELFYNTSCLTRSFRPSFSSFSFPFHFFWFYMAFLLIRYDHSISISWLPNQWSWINATIIFFHNSKTKLAIRNGTNLSITFLSKLTNFWERVTNIRKLLLDFPTKQRNKKNFRAVNRFSCKDTLLQNYRLTLLSVG